MVARRSVIQSSESRCFNFLRIGSHYGVRSHLHCDRPLGIFAQGQTGDSQKGCFFLNPARVCEHKPRSTVELHLQGPHHRQKALDQRHRFPKRQTAAPDRPVAFLFAEIGPVRSALAPARLDSVAVPVGKSAGS